MRDKERELEGEEGSPYIYTCTVCTFPRMCVLFIFRGGGDKVLDKK